VSRKEKVKFFLFSLFLFLLHFFCVWTHTFHTLHLSHLEKKTHIVVKTKNNITHGMNADIAARVRILDDDDDALARFCVLFLSKKEARFVSFQTLRAESIFLFSHFSL